MENDSLGKVRPKKFLGQHFLRDQNAARKIVEALEINDSSSEDVLEIGPGMGVLTQYLVNRKDIRLTAIEIDRESVAYLKVHYKEKPLKIVEGDFLEINLADVFTTRFHVIGNFPYNISSQIFFRVLEYRDQVDQVVCMLQKEVADRIASSHGNKTYGILSVLLQAYYHVEHVLKVPPGAFHPPPKVMSAVIRLKRNQRKRLECNEQLFVQVVKQGFNMRRKTLRNALKNLNLTGGVTSLPVMDKRAEQLSVEDFISLTKTIEESRAGTNG